MLLCAMLCYAMCYAMLCTVFMAHLVTTWGFEQKFLDVLLLQCSLSNWSFHWFPDLRAMLECSVPIGQSEVEGPMRSQATRSETLPSAQLSHIQYTRQYASKYSFSCWLVTIALSSAVHCRCLLEFQTHQIIYSHKYRNKHLLGAPTQHNSSDTTYLNSTMGETARKCCLDGIFCRFCIDS